MERLLLNTDLLFNLILPQVLGSTIWGLGLAIALGGSIGLIMSLFTRKPAKTVPPAIFGCFFAVMLGCLLPIISTPGIVGGGPYGGIIIFFLLSVLLPPSCIIGSILGYVFRDKFAHIPLRRRLLLLLLGTYAVMGLGMYVRITVHCLRPNTVPLYCSEAGFPNSLYP